MAPSGVPLSPKRQSLAHFRNIQPPLPSLYVASGSVVGLGCENKCTITRAHCIARQAAPTIGQQGPICSNTSSIAFV